MKTENIVQRSILLILILFVVSCEEDDGGFHQISGIESQVHNKINEYRANQGLNELVSQYVMFKEEIGRAHV